MPTNAHTPSAETAQVIGVRHNADGTSECVVAGDRYMLRIEPSKDRLTIDPDVVIEGDVFAGYRLTAPFTSATIMTTVSSRIIVHGPLGVLNAPSPLSGEYPDTMVDQHALLTHAVRTGERVLRLSDFRLPPGERT